MITSKRYGRIELLLREAGYGPIMEWSENIAEPTDSEAFARETTFVVCGSGFRNALAVPIVERCMLALRNGHSAATEFGHPGKAKAIDYIWANRDALFAGYCAEENTIEYLQTMPWIGPITAWHLAKNLGGDHAKPDVHMERLARREKTTTFELCARLSRETGRKISRIDTVLWRACADQLLDSARYESEGWKAAFSPKRFLASHS